MMKYRFCINRTPNKRHVWLLKDAIIILGILLILCACGTTGDTEHSEIKVAFYGTNSVVIEKYINDFNASNNGYRAELCLYDPTQTDGEAAMDALLVDLTSGDAPDVVFANRAISSYYGFVDLNDFLSVDETLSYDDFVPGLLSGIERDGKLFQLWDGFYIGTVCGYGVPSDDYLTLERINATVLEKGERTALFSSIVNRDSFLSSVLPGAISRCIDLSSLSCDFDTDEMREIITLCAKLPAEPAFEETSSYAVELLTLACADATPYVFLDNEVDNMRFFSKNDNADNYTILWCRTGGCMMIPSRSDKQQEAWKFISFVLSDDEQQTVRAVLSTNVGFPVRSDVLRQELDKSTDEDGKVPLLKTEQKRRIEALIESAEVMNASTADIVSLVLNTAESLIENAYSTDDIINQLNTKVSIYIAEQYG